MSVQFEDLSELEQIELILLEANAYNLKAEVEMYAQKFINEGTSRLEAYSLAFDEWCK